MLLIARTQALSSGADRPKALERAQSYAAAGADAVLITGTVSRWRRVRRLLAALFAPVEQSGGLLGCGQEPGELSATGRVDRGPARDLRGDEYPGLAGTFGPRRCRRTLRRPPRSNEPSLTPGMPLTR
ncbi:isocitrate lyase/phosphoenolpyruvate mutase family protein [Streptomyces sp. NPDC058239]|uniref:isocitrate lyase/phosphoenolpyruvate mutase family protein n=1 Tax=unclassified Streptomyces TaxID=2593676 RepID=UPI00364726F5